MDKPDASEGEVAPEDGDRRRRGDSELQEARSLLADAKTAMATLTASIDNLATKREIRVTRWVVAVAVLVLVVAVGYGTWNRHDINQEGRERDKAIAQALCDSVNQSKLIQREVLNAMVAVSGNGREDETPEEAKLRLEATADFFERIEVLLQPINCADFAEHPEKYRPGPKPEDPTPPD